MTRTPFRISFSGGSSDLPEYLEKTGYGCVISSAIDKYMYIALNKNFYNNFGFYIKSSLHKCLYAQFLHSPFGSSLIGSNSKFLIFS